MEKQTAVQWLESEIEKQIFQCETEWQCGYQKALNEVVFLLRQTKEMEKQQIIDSYYQGDAESDNHNLDAEQYYNETFKSE
jgi:hypothetical protein